MEGAKLPPFAKMECIIMSIEEKKEVSKVKIGDQKINLKDELLRHQIRVLLGLEQLTSDEDVHEIEQN